MEVQNMSTLITARINENDKKDFDSFCENVGLTTSTAINMFIKAVLREYRIPFDIYDDTFYCKNNQESIKGSQELEPDFVEVDN